MITFVWIVLLALAWMAMTERFTLPNLVFGFLLAYLVIYVSQRVVQSAAFIRKLNRFIVLLIVFVKELVVANFRVAYDVITPTYYMRPGIVAVPLDAKTDSEITMLANLISLTPGSLSLDVSSDRKVLYVYNMFVDDRDEFIREVKQEFERRILEILR